MRHEYARYRGNPEKLSRASIEALRELRRSGLYAGPIPGDWIAPPEGSTQRGVPPDYMGDDPALCNARTKSGRPCRALKLAHGRCKWHGGLSTGPKTPEGKAKCAEALRRWREARRNDGIA